MTFFQFHLFPGEDGPWVAASVFLFFYLFIYLFIYFFFVLFFLEHVCSGLAKDSMEIHSAHQYTYSLVIWVTQNKTKKECAPNEGHHYLPFIQRLVGTW